MADVAKYVCDEADVANLQCDFALFCRLFYGSKNPWSIRHQGYSDHREVMCTQYNGQVFNKVL